tara:strand:- start:2312 stop:3706 length:1395 start_codon:yes stop_codon:yes gene_type:complete
VRLILFFLLISSSVLLSQQKLPINDTIQNFLFAQSETKKPIIITKNGVFEYENVWKYLPFKNHSFKKELEKIDELNHKNFFTIIISNKLYLVSNGAGPVFLKDGNSFKRIDNSSPHKNQFGGARFVFNNKIHIYGGYGFWSFKNFITFFDENINQWDLVYNNSKYIPPGRWKPIYSLINDKLYVLGGRIGSPGSQNQDEIFSDMFYFDFSSKEFVNLGKLNPKLKESYSLFSLPKSGNNIFLLNNNLIKIDFESLEFTIYYKKMFSHFVDNKYPTYINNQILYFISNQVGEKKLNSFDLNQLNKNFESKTFSLINDEPEIPHQQYLLFGLFIAIVFWIILKIFSFKDYIKGLILYDEKYIYFNNETVLVNTQEQQLISFLSSNSYISALNLNFIISSQSFTKSHFTSLRNKLVSGLNQKLFLLTKNKNCIIETKHPKDNRVKVYKADSSIIKKKISFLRFLFKT